MMATPNSTGGRRGHRAALISMFGALILGGLLLPAARAAAAVPPIKHVFVLIEENESASTTFGASSPAPYLSKTLTAEGAFLPNYYGVGHSSLDNYIAMVSGQAPNTSTSSDCGTFADFPSPMTTTSYGQENGEGCVYPTSVPTLMSQLDGAGLTWRAYEDDMGANPADQSATCGHPTIGTTDTGQGEDPADQYATRHDPFVYFHYVIDNTTECDANVVNLSRLQGDLASASTTPNYVFITPDVCDDGHDATCANGGPGGLAQADTFLKTYVPMITSSPAFQQNGLLIITFDEAAASDATACCGEIPGPGEAQPGGTGPGGGDAGAVLLSPYIAPGTVSQTAYNHYSMLGSVEDIFGLPHIGYAQLPGETYFGSDIYTRPNGPDTTTTTTTTTPTPTPTPKPTAPQDSGLKLTPASFAPTGTDKSAKHHGAVISYSDTQAAVTTLVITRAAKGSRTGHRACHALKPGKRRAKGTKPCTVTVMVGSLTHQDVAGANRVPFTGRLRGHALAAGSYTVTGTPVLGTLKGMPVTARLHII